MRNWSMQLALSVLVLSFVLAGPARAEEPKKAATTLEALQMAYNGESNASAKYAAYAKKADEEGYPEVGVLFRATSKAETIHAAHHGKVIKALGAEPKAVINTPAAKTTKENLEDSLAGESYEVSPMYPEFIALAEKDKNTNAIATFTRAKAAEAVHAQLYKDTLARLDTLKGAPAKEFFVCPVCGNTVSSVSFQKCPICGDAGADFVKVK